jgi:dolichol kinase
MHVTNKHVRLETERRTELKYFHTVLFGVLIVWLFNAEEILIIYWISPIFGSSLVLWELAFSQSPTQDPLS